MNKIYFLGKIGEISLKKGNKRYFENRLSENLKILLGKIDAKITVRAGRLILQTDVQNRAISERALSHLLGITSWAEMTVCDKDITEIIECTQKKATEAKSLGAKTFKIEVRRADKAFPLKSYEIAEKVGAKIHDKILQTDVHNPNITVTIEVREKVFIYSLQNECFRGLPVGVSGHGLLLLSGGIDSPVAGFKMLTRGMKLDCVYFHSYPYTSDDALKKVEMLAQRLADFGLTTFLNIVPFTEIQQQLKASLPEEYLTLMMRICMMKLASKIAKRIKADCLITGESLGQVASQTVQNLNITNSASEHLVLRPLIGLDKQDITNFAKRIGTYETSILPYDDCCVLFSPKHPSLHTDPKKAYELFLKMEIEPYLEKAFEDRNVKKFSSFLSTTD